jgi:hypothetical protein
MLRTCLIGTISLTAALCLCGGAESSATVAKVTSVTFTGNEIKPTITIKGTGFGVQPTPNPPYHPPALDHPLCRAKPPLPLSRYGYDYGSDLFLQDSSQTPAWSAGRYRPSLRELDCIGLLISKYTPTVIVFRLGAAYPLIPGIPGAYALETGDKYVIGVGSARHVGRVRYG